MEDMTRRYDPPFGDAVLKQGWPPQPVLVLHTFAELSGFVCLIAALIKSESNDAAMLEKLREAVGTLAQPTAELRTAVEQQTP